MRCVANRIWLILWGLAPYMATAQNQEKLTRYFQVAALPQQSVTERALLVDTDTLFQVLSANGEPLSYYQKITTEVCFDGNCRLLRVHLYWNVTGRYLGFELPPKEFLSKAEHEPFHEGEYHELGKILADSLSPLREFSYDDLMPKSSAGGLLDGVTGPTSTDVLRYVVKGAVYTTYTLWHLVYGPTRNAVMRFTEKALTSGLVCKLLASPDNSDRYWVLNRIHGRVPITAELQRALLQVISGPSYSLAERALAALPSSSLSDDSLQSGLLKAFIRGDYSLRQLIVEKLSEAPALSGELVSGLAAQLHQLNGEPLAGIFRLFRKFKVADDEVIGQIRTLQNSPNSYIANMAARYLKEVKSFGPVPGERSP